MNMIFLLFVLVANGVFSKPFIEGNLPFNITTAEDNPTFNLIAQTLSNQSAGADDRRPDDRWTFNREGLKKYSHAMHLASRRLGLQYGPSPPAPEAVPKIWRLWLEVS